MTYDDKLLFAEFLKFFFLGGGAVLLVSFCVYMAYYLGPWRWKLRQGWPFTLDDQ